MRTQPQRRFSRPRRTMSSTISSPSGGRPGPRRARHRFHPATRELPVPAKRGLGRDEKATPAPPWKKLAERSEDRAVRGPVAHAAMELPLEHADLVAKHHQLDVLVQSCPSARSQCLKNAARDEVAETDAHGQMMVDDAEEGQLKGPIDFLAPYSSGRTASHVGEALLDCSSDGRWSRARSSSSARNRTDSRTGSRAC